VLKLIGHVATVAARDLPYQRGREACALGAGRLGDPVKRQKQSRALPLPDHRSLVTEIPGRSPAARSAGYRILHRPGPGEGWRAAESIARALERLGQIVVRAHFQPDHPIGRIATGSEHQDRRVGADPDLSTDFEPVHVR
jgi:hypothetical protein